MKAILFILIFCSSLFAQYKEGASTIEDYTFDTTVYCLTKFNMDMNIESQMDALMLQHLIRFEQKKETAYVREDYWQSLGFHGRAQIATFMAILCGNANKNYKYPLIIRSWETNRTLGTFIAPKSYLKKISEVTNFYDPNTGKVSNSPNPQPTYEKVLLWDEAIPFIERLKCEDRIVFARKEVVVLSYLWDSWDEQMKKDMTMIFALYMGNKLEDYSYDMTVKILKEDLFTPKHMRKIASRSTELEDLPVVATFKRPSDIETFQEENMLVSKRFVLTNPNKIKLIGGEKDKITRMIIDKNLFIDHHNNKAYIRGTTWYDLSPKQQRILTTLIAVKCGNDRRSTSYKISINDMYTHSKVYATFNRGSFSLASL